MLQNKYTIRRATSEDLQNILALFYETVRYICIQDYNEVQIKAWTSSIKDEDRWLSKIASQYFIVLEKDNKIIGFSSLENNNYIDFLFVHKDHQNKGIANIMFQHLESIALANDTKKLEADVSITAKSFFLRKGFEIIKEQINIRENIEFINYKMIKNLKYE